MSKRWGISQLRHLTVAAWTTRRIGLGRAGRGIGRRDPTRQASIAAMFDPDTLQLWKFLHILGAIAAFGFGFYAPIFGMAVAKEPQHSNWFSRASRRVSNVVILPFGIFMLITGAALVESSAAWDWSTRWLSVALLLYVISLGIVFFLQRPSLNKAIELSAQPPGPDGPPAELLKHSQRMKIYGVVLLLLTIVILALMVFKPALGQ